MRRLLSAPALFVTGLVLGFFVGFATALYGNADGNRAWRIWP